MEKKELAKKKDVDPDLEPDLEFDSKVDFILVRKLFFA